MQNLVILGQTVLEMYDGLTLYEQRQRRWPMDPMITRAADVLANFLARQL